MRRIVVVHGPAMRSWLQLRMALDEDFKVAMGIEWVYLKEAFSVLVGGGSKYIPSFLELSLGIERELLALISEGEESLVRYLKLSLDRPFSRKMERRLTALSMQLAKFFQGYGRYAYQMVFKWEDPSFVGWQPRLWRRLFCGDLGWTYPAKAFGEVKDFKSLGAVSVHFFSISFIGSAEFAFLHRLSASVPMYYYWLSPCAVFWSDIRSDRERARLHEHWKKRDGPVAMQLEEFLQDRNPLLANFGRLGREMAECIERSEAVTHAQYIVSASILAVSDEIGVVDDVVFSDNEKPLSLLEALQGDLVFMRNPEGLPVVDLEEGKGVQLHVAPNKRREVQILYNNISKLLADDSSLSPGDVIVMTPDIEEYLPHIQSIFGLKTSIFDFHILDLGMESQGEIVQGFLQLLELCETKWDVSRLLQLFAHPSFQRKHQFTDSDYGVIKDWVLESGIRWGDDLFHRNDLLKRRHCEREMTEEFVIGTWEYGISRLLLGLAASESSSVPPCHNITFSESDLLGKWVHILHSLRDDLSPLEGEAKMTINDWVDYLICLLESYFQPDYERAQSIAEYDELKEQMEILRGCSMSFAEETWSFLTVKTHLKSLFKGRGISYSEEKVNSVRFCSLVPLRAIPAKVIAMMGMQEGAFPKIDEQSSLNLSLGERKVDYCPLTNDLDRYLFLEAIHAASDCLLISYQGYSSGDGTLVLPSLVVEELFSYLDKYYTVCGKTVSSVCRLVHPFDAFDASYFNEKSSLKSFSSFDFLAAEACFQEVKVPAHRFLDGFVFYKEHTPATALPSKSQVDVREFSAAARNPIKFHLNRSLNIYLNTDEERSLKTEEELFVSPLDRYRLKEFAMREPLETVLSAAEREGKLPFGLFGQVATLRMKEERLELEEALAKQGVSLSELFQIEFCGSCSFPVEKEKGLWLFPPVSLLWEDGYELSITGKLPYVHQRGLLSMGKGGIGDIWKMWPQYLLYCHAIALAPRLGSQKELIFARASRNKKPMCGDPKEALKQFASYYSLCLHTVSPLLPDWIPFILEENSKGLENKMQSLFSSFAMGYQDPYLSWVMREGRLPCSESIILDWKPVIDSFGFNV